MLALSFTLSGVNSVNILLPKSVESEFDVFMVKTAQSSYYAPVQTLNSWCGEMHAFLHKSGQGDRIQVYVFPDIFGLIPYTPI